MRFAAIIASALILGAGCSSVHEIKSNQIASFVWDVGDRQSLKVVVIEVKQRNEPVPSRTLKIIDNGREVFAHQTADTFLGAIPLADEKGHLLSLWMGGSSYHFLVIGEQDGRFIELLEAGSKMPPELVFPASNLEQRPFILATDGLMSQRADGWTTRVFYWDGRSYQSKDPVPYLTRLSQLRN